MRPTSRRLNIERLDCRVLLAADVATLTDVASADDHGRDEIRACFAEDVVQRDNSPARRTPRQAAANHDFWPDQISLPEGLEPEGIELGKGQDFFVGGFSYSSFFGPLFGLEYPESEMAGAIYKGNLRTGEGQMLVDPTDNLLISGLSYDARTDYLYAATLESGAITGPFIGGGINVYDGTTGQLIQRTVFGNGLAINDVLVTNKAVYATDSLSATLYKIPLDRGGQPSPEWETVSMDGFDMVPNDFNANGLVGDFDGEDLVVVNVSSGLLYHVDTQSGAATAIDVQGEQTIFESGDGLFMQGRTLYIMQNQASIGGPGKIAVVELSGDLSRGTFVKDITSPDFVLPTTIIGHGDSIYAVNSQFGAALDDPSSVQSQVVKVKK